MQRDPAAPPVLDGYTAVRVLGLGGFSDVYLYEQHLPRRHVAVKVLSAALTDAVRSAFVREANLMAALSTHPYIVTIHHAGVAADGRPYLVMEYCSRPSLAERYKRQPLSVADTLRTGIRIAGAVATLHGAGILHRDIKPANVLTNDYGWPALTDFGIATAFATGGTGGASVLGGGGGGAGVGGGGPGSGGVSPGGPGGPGGPGAGGDGFGAGGEGDRSSGSGSGLGLAPGLAGPGTGAGAGAPQETGTGTIGLSVPWSPPEMFVDVPDPDVRSDVFSLAATLYTVLAGRTPFEVRGGPNGQLDLIARIERGEVTPLSRTDVPVSLVAALARGMAPRRQDRWAGALDFARALQRVELELGYAPTGIEVPTGDTGPGRPAAEIGDGEDDPDEDATRMRAMPTVLAQPPGRPGAATARPGEPPRGAGSTPAAGGSAAGTSEAVRNAPGGPGVTPGGPGVVPDGPRVVPGEPGVGAGGSGVAHGGPGAVPGTAQGPGRSRRGTVVALVIGVLAVLAVAAIIVAVLIGGAPRPDANGPSPAHTGGSAVVGPDVPQPVKGVATVAADGTSVAFSWTNPSPKSGDVYYWAPSETPDDRTVTPDPRAVVTGVVPGSRVCIDVAIGRAGRNSAPERICTS